MAKTAYSLTKNMRENIKQGMKLNNFLNVLFPGSTYKERQKWYRDYLLEQIKSENKYAGEKEIKGMVDERIMKAKNDGIEHDLKTAEKIRKFGISASKKKEMPR
jgi:hypothetical protein